MMSSTDVIIIGAGAAGITAALGAAEFGAKVTIYEKTKRLGTKILISGGGKCNITHDGPIEEVLKAFRKKEAIFLRPSFYAYPPHRIVELLTDRGLEVYTRPNGRIFPVDQTAKDVVAILLDVLMEAGVEVRFESPVQRILVEDGAVTGVRLRGGEVVRASRVIVTVGGSSYPNSGTTGDGFDWMEDLGHTVVPVRAALAPMYLEFTLPELSGIAFRDCVLRGKAGSKEIGRWKEDLLITHQGISGPCALGISREVAEAMVDQEVTLRVDCVPEVAFEELQRRFQAEAHENPHLLASTWLSDYVAERVAALLLERANLDGQVTLGKTDKKSRNLLIDQLKSFDLGPVYGVPLEKGEVVAGGVSLEEVDPKTMRSKLISGLWIAGEILDIAGPVGGYNLQAAWSTGFVAGKDAAQV